MQDVARNVFAQDSWQTPRNARTLRAYMALRDREIGERIAGLRKAKGNPPQEIVAQKLGVSNRSYQSWEAGDTKPSWRNLSKLAKYYGVTEEWVLLGDERAPEPYLNGNGPSFEEQVLARLELIEDLIRSATAANAARVAEAIQLLEDRLPPNAASRRRRPA